jgi:hypothetical protein
MRNGTQKRIKVYLESVGEGVTYERLFRALSLILSEGDLIGYLLSNQNNILNSGIDKRNKKSEVTVENLANS